MDRMQFSIEEATTGLHKAYEETKRQYQRQGAQRPMLHDADLGKGFTAAFGAPLQQALATMHERSLERMGRLLTVLDQAQKEISQAVGHDQAHAQSLTGVKE